jgi:hypothetical protein
MVDGFKGDHYISTNKSNVIISEIQLYEFINIISLLKKLFSWQSFQSKFVCIFGCGKNKCFIPSPGCPQATKCIIAIPCHQATKSLISTTPGEPWIRSLEFYKPYINMI